MFSANNKTHNYIERDPNESVEDLEVDMQFFYNELAPKNSEAIYR